MVHGTFVGTFAGSRIDFRVFPAEDLLQLSPLFGRACDLSHELAKLHEYEGGEREYTQDDGGDGSTHGSDAPLRRR